MTDELDLLMATPSSYTGSYLGTVARQMPASLGMVSAGGALWGVAIGGIVSSLGGAHFGV